MEKIQTHLIGDVISSNSQDAFTLHKKSHFGEPTGEKIRYSFSEALFLSEKKKLEVTYGNKKVPFKDLMKKLQRKDRRIQVKYAVYRDLRERGYVVKTALKFGADFRIYDKGSKPGKRHAKWIVFADSESKRISWSDFSAKNRVAHSTKKKLLLAVVDEESDVSYYEVSWIKP